MRRRFRLKAWLKIGRYLCRVLQSTREHRCLLFNFLSSRFVRKALIIWRLSPLPWPLRETEATQISNHSMVLLLRYYVLFKLYERTQRLLLKRPWREEVKHSLTRTFVVSRSYKCFPLSKRPIKKTLLKLFTLMPEVKQCMKHLEISSEQNIIELNSTVTWIDRF